MSGKRAERFKRAQEQREGESVEFVRSDGSRARVLGDGLVIEAGVCPACDGDGRIPDKSGGGHHGTCPLCGGSGEC